jgi:phage gpG-like protein
VGIQGGEKITELADVFASASSGETKATMLKLAAAEALKLVQLGFRKGVDPYGKPWAPLKRRNGKPLRDTGRLANSFTARPTAEGFVVGTNTDYAPHHQWGAPKAGIEQRGMVPQPTLSEPWAKSIGRVLENVLKAAVRGKG